MAEAYFMRGLAYSYKDFYDVAVKDFSKAIELDPTNSGYYYNRANTYKYMNEFQKAILDYQKAKELNPNTEDFDKNIALCKKSIEENLMYQ